MLRLSLVPHIPIKKQRSININVCMRYNLETKNIPSFPVVFIINDEVKPMLTPFAKIRSSIIIKPYLKKPHNHIINVVFPYLKMLSVIAAD